MGKINVLDFHVANMIAAGEVVDRPASVVKELLENAIDAEANEITVEIKRGGITFIRVSDNGFGMTRDDVQLSIKRHATSKIKEATDLDGIMTLGFRGEALAAISSVSALRIMTRARGEENGTLLVSNNGEISDISDAGCREGTTVIVEELFANMPARRKFLKKDLSEGLAVGAVAEKIALSRPDISITFINDNQRKFTTAGDGKLYNAVYAVLGRDFAKKSAEVNGITDGVEVNGYIGRPDNTKANRNCQNFFINGRYVKSRTASAALEAAFDSYIPSDRFPVCVLNIILHPAYVDVNVHPAKLEVKFSNEKIVFDAIYSSIRNTLCNKLDRPKISIEAASLTGDDVRVLNPFVPIYDRFATDDNGKTDENSQRTIDYEAEPQLVNDELTKDNTVLQNDATSTIKLSTQTITATSSSLPEIEETTTSIIHNENSKDPFGFAEMMPPAIDIDLESYAKEDKDSTTNIQTAYSQSLNYVSPGEKRRNPEIKPPPYKLIGEAFNSYVFLELDNTVLMIDKHAAHERIIFEEMKRNMYEGNQYSQILMLPIELSFSAEEISALTDYKNELLKCGFEYELTPDNKPNVTVSQIPGELDENQAETLLSTIAGRLAEGTGTVKISRDMFYEKALYQASCKAAIKAGRIYSEENIKWICDRLLTLTDIKVCPHGRPVAIEMTRHDIEHRFGRV